MWTDNTRNAKIKGGNKGNKITRGHNFTLVKKQSRSDRLSESVTDTDSQIIPTVRQTTAVHDV